MTTRNASAGFTGIELVLVVLLLALIVWGVNHCFGSSGAPTVKGTAQEVSALDNVAESVPKKVAKIILVGLLMAGGIAWQVFLIAEHDNLKGPRRVVPAVVAAAVLFLGVLVVSLIEVFDDRRSVSFGWAAANVGKVSVLGVSLVSKAYLAPITAAFTLSCVVYFLFTYGEMRMIPFVQGVFDWAFSGAPNWISWSYAAVISIYSLGSAIHDADLQL